MGEEKKQGKTGRNIQGHRERVKEMGNMQEFMEKNSPPNSEVDPNDVLDGRRLFGRKMGLSL